jgi:hypothetical protein
VSVPTELHAKIELESRGAADASKGTRQWRVKIPELGIKNFGTPMYIPLGVCQDWEVGETKYVHVGRNDRPKDGKQGEYASDYFWNYVGPGDPNAAVAPPPDYDAPFPVEGALLRQQPPAPQQQTQRPATGIDGMRWGNSLNNAAALIVAYPDLSLDELYNRVMPLAARMYVATSDDIVAFAAQQPEGATDA